MKSFNFYNDLKMTPEERKQMVKSGFKQAAILLFIVPWIVLAITLIIIFTI